MNEMNDKIIGNVEKELDEIRDNRYGKYRREIVFYCIWNYSVLLKLDYLCRKNRTMFLKILILDVHRQKNFGNLKGSTPKEQYDYYEKNILTMQHM